MNSTAQALVDLLRNAVPTVVFFIFLAFYLKRIFFEPLSGILEERRKATEGVRHLADEAQRAADEKTSEFERAMAQARAELHKENEKLRDRWTEEQAQAVATARIEAAARVDKVRQDTEAEVTRVRSEIEGRVDELAAQIVRSLLGRKAA